MLDLIHIIFEGPHGTHVKVRCSEKWFVNHKTGYSFGGCYRCKLCRWVIVNGTGQGMDGGGGPCLNPSVAFMSHCVLGQFNFSDSVFICKMELATDLLPTSSWAVSIIKYFVLCRWVHRKCCNTWLPCCPGLFVSPKLCLLKPWSVRYSEVEPLGGNLVWRVEPSRQGGMPLQEGTRERWSLSVVWTYSEKATTANHEDGSHQNLTVWAPWFGTSVLQNCKK